MEKSKLIIFLLVLLVLLAVCMTLFSPIQSIIKLIIRIILIAIFFAAWRWFHRRELTDLKDLAFVFLVLNLAFLIVTHFTTEFWHLKPDTAQGFAVPHLTVNYSPNVLLFSGIVLVLGMICGFAMQYTRSIIAPMLIHAGADLLIIIPVFTAYGVNA